MTRAANISPDVVIMTRRELDVVEQAAFQRGVERGKFEASMAAGKEPVARNCKNWTQSQGSAVIGTCQRCGVQWQYMEVGADYKCPHFEERK